MHEEPWRKREVHVRYAGTQLPHAGSRSSNRLCAGKEASEVRGQKKRKRQKTVGEAEEVQELAAANCARRIQTQLVSLHGEDEECQESTERQSCRGVKGEEDWSHDLLCEPNSSDAILCEVWQVKAVCNRTSSTA